MNKQEAAEFLGVSVRALERYASAGKVPSRYVRGKTGQVLNFEQADLEAFKRDLETPIAKATTGLAEPRQDATREIGNDFKTSVDVVRQGSTRALATLDEPSSPTFVQLMQALATASFDKGRQGPTVSVADKIFLTITEAAAYAGVGKRALESAIKAGSLPAHNGLGQGRRVKRADVEDWASKL